MSCDINIGIYGKLLVYLLPSGHAKHVQFTLLEVET